MNILHSIKASLHLLQFSQNINNNYNNKKLNKKQQFQYHNKSLTMI